LSTSRFRFQNRSQTSCPGSSIMIPNLTSTQPQSARIAHFIPRVRSRPLLACHWIALTRFRDSLLHDDTHRLACSPRSDPATMRVAEPAATLWGMWKTGSAYRADWVGLALASSPSRLSGCSGDRGQAVPVPVVVVVRRRQQTIQVVAVLEKVGGARQLLALSPIPLFSLLGKPECPLCSSPLFILLLFQCLDARFQLGKAFFQPNDDRDQLSLCVFIKCRHAHHYRTLTPSRSRIGQETCERLLIQVAQWLERYQDFAQTVCRIPGSAALAGR